MTENGADRSLTAGLLLAGAAHLALLAALSLGRRDPPAPPAEPTPLEVSLVTEVAPEAQAPPAPTPPAPSVAPETGPPEEAPPPPAPEPRPAPAKPAPAAPDKPTPPKLAPPAPAKQAAAPKPVPVAPARPAVAAKPAPSRPAPAAPARPSRLAGLNLGTAAGTNPASTAARPRGQRLGSNFLAGLAPDAPSRTPSPAAPAARAGPYPTASIVGAIARQIQPCADRQVNPGPGANRIVTTLNIRLNADGTLAATPTRVRQSGVNDENERYAQRVVDLGIAAFKGCSPLRLPADYYQTASGGWNNINYQWQLR